MGLPQPLFLAIQKVQNQYNSEGSYLSCSGVLKPAKIFHLEKRYDPEIEAIHMIPSFLGTLQHDSCEEAAKEIPNVQVEQRVSVEIEGEKFSGQYDVLWEDGHLQDYKQTTAFQVMKEKEEWPAQLSCLKFLLSKNGQKVRKASIEATIRDWSPSKAQYEANYPKRRHLHIPIKLWPLEKTEDFIRERIKYLKQYEDVPDDEIPPCSESDRWNTGTKYAVMKKGGKRATKLHDNSLDAEIHAKQIQGYVEVRKGYDRRCCEQDEFKNPMYCFVREHCSYWKENYGPDKRGD